MISNGFYSTLQGLDANAIRVIQVGVPGSGSTYIWQILADLYPDGVIKTHDADSIPANIPAVLSIRDVRAAFVSNYRMRFPSTRLPDAPQLRALAEDFCRLSESIATLTTRPRTLIVKYEQFTESPDILFDALERFLNIAISSDRRAEIYARHSVAVNEAIQASVVGDYDPITLVHRDQLHGASHGAWRLWAGRRAVDLLTGVFRHLLLALGYNAEEVA